AAQDAPAVGLLNLLIAARRGSEERAESVALAGDRQFLAAVAGDLQEEAGVGSAFVQLAGRVQVARTEAEGAGSFRRLADCALQLMELVLQLARGRQIGEQRDVIARLGEREMRGDPSG